jgi:D-sedoheptulose 7-phosphate isomerase
MRELLESKINSAINSFSKLGESDLISDILTSTNIIVKALKSKKKIIFCGNGGSAADSQHLSAELVGKFKKKRKALNSISLTTDTSAITSIGNDMGFDKVFSRQLEAIGEKGDVLFALTTSGKSANILNVLKVSKKKKIKIILLSSKFAKKTKLCNVNIRPNASRVDRIQELHIAIGHLICEMLEQELT